MRHQVKFEDDDAGTVYGIVDQHSELGRKAQARGKLRVLDVITNHAFTVDAASVTDIPLGTPKMEDGEWVQSDELGHYVHAARKKAEAESSALEGLQAGRLFVTPVADGHACYLVTEVGKRTVKVAWRGFYPDRWHCRVLGAGGSFPRSMIEKFRFI